MASTYSRVDDMLLGDMPIGLNSNAQKYVDDAADEVDSVIGARYDTPIPMASPVARHSYLLIARIANHIASGRFILAQHVGAPDGHLHAYGQSLIRDAQAALAAVANGSVELVGATLLDQPDTDSSEPVRIVGGDTYSAVDVFYGNVMADPSWAPSDLWAPGVYE